MTHGATKVDDQLAPYLPCLWLKEGLWVVEGCWCPTLVQPSPPISMLTGFYPHNLQLHQVLHRASSSGTISGATPPPIPSPLGGIGAEPQQQSLQQTASRLRQRVAGNRFSSFPGSRKWPTAAAMAADSSSIGSSSSQPPGPVHHNQLYLLLLYLRQLIFPAQHHPQQQPQQQQL